MRRLLRSNWERESQVRRVTLRSSDQHCMVNWWRRAAETCADHPLSTTLKMSSSLTLWKSKLQRSRNCKFTRQRINLQTQREQSSCFRFFEGGGREATGVHQTVSKFNLQSTRAARGRSMKTESKTAWNGRAQVASQGTLTVLEEYGSDAESPRRSNEMNKNSEQLSSRSRRRLWAEQGVREA